MDNWECPDWLVPFIPYIKGVIDKEELENQMNFDHQCGECLVRTQAQVDILFRLKAKDIIR